MGITRAAVLILSATIASLLASGPPALGEEPPASLELELKRAQKRPHVTPPPHPEIVETDAARAIAEIKARERLDELIRAANYGPRWRPDLSHDVISGIQQRSMQDALRRR